MTTPEELARIYIAPQPTACVWTVQDVTQYNCYARLDVIAYNFLVEEI